MLTTTILFGNNAYAPHTLIHYCPEKESEKKPASQIEKDQGTLYLARKNMKKDTSASSYLCSLYKYNGSVVVKENAKFTVMNFNKSSVVKCT